MEGTSSSPQPPLPARAPKPLYQPHQNPRDIHCARFHASQPAPSRVWHISSSHPHLLPPSILEDEPLWALPLLIVFPPPFPVSLSCPTTQPEMRVDTHVQDKQSLDGTQTVCFYTYRLLAISMKLWWSCLVALVGRGAMSDNGECVWCVRVSLGINQFSSRTSHMSELNMFSQKPKTIY